MRQLLSTVCSRAAVLAFKNLVPLGHDDHRVPHEKEKAPLASTAACGKAVATGRLEAKSSVDSCWPATTRKRPAGLALGRPNHPLV